MRESKLFALWLLLSHSYYIDGAEQVNCDVVIGGGNTAAMSAAITAAQSAQSQNQKISICLLAPTDWIGGQMTTEGIANIDYGPHNGNKPQNQPKSFQSAVNTVGDPGRCGSYTCYQPQDLINQWILPTLSNLSEYIHVYYRTVIINTFNSTDPSTGNKYISSVSAIQRTPIDPSKEWTYLLSQQLQDWYSPNNSSLFTKKQYIFKGKIFIEATEFGDIIMTSGIEENDIFQGAESPNENSTTTKDLCGEGITFPLYIKILETIPDNPPIVPPGSDEGVPYVYPNNWLSVWLERRAYDAVPNSPKNQVNLGDISGQTWWGGDDYRNGYVFLSVKDAKQQSDNNEWKSGVNITSLYKAEQRSYGWYHFYANASRQNYSNLFDPKQLILDFNCTGTKTGLAKLPYMRDTRRTYGLFGFRLNHTTMMDLWNQTSINGTYPTGYKFHDTVAIGDYNFFDITLHILHNDSQCPSYPSYVWNGGENGKDKIVPYYIPFRSIGNNEFANLLFGGKNIAQTFFANSATRLHPVEWNTGVAAGVSAQYMVMNNINDTKIVYNQIHELQKLLQSQTIQQPLDWS